MKGRQTRKKKPNAWFREYERINKHEKLLEEIRRLTEEINNLPFARKVKLRS